MKHLSQQMFTTDQRRPHLDRWRRRMKSLLLSEGIDADARRQIERRVREIGEPKRYGLPGSPGALHPGPQLVRLDFPATFDSLAATPHALLHQFAIQRGLPDQPSNTKAQTVALILEHLKDQQP